MTDQRQQISAKLALLGSDEEPQLLDWLESFALLSGERARTNLCLINERLQDAELLAALLEQALASADPDGALNLLERLFEVVASESLAAQLSEPQRRRQLLTILGGSPFLAGILCRKASYFEQLFLQDGIDQSVSETEMLAELRELIPDESDFPDLKAGLRRYKGEQVLRIGSRDLCGLAPLEEVTAELTALAAACLQRAFEICSNLLQAEYGEPNQETDDGRQPAEFSILGMGKFGGHELNFSSDIDLIYCYSSTNGQTCGGSRGEQISLHRYFVKLGELVGSALHQVTEDGFVFRVDTRLRPDGNNGDLAVSLDAAEIYYESWGQSWERAAMIKARPVAGSIALGNELIERLKPFVYRRYLDFGMLEDIKLMKQKINASLSRGQEAERNLKLGRGGIREIEFFIQALQLVNGGKQPQLQNRNSLQTLQLLADEGLIGAEDCRDLTEAYRLLRTVEHRIQIVQERQTHSLPQDEDELLALARRCGFAGWDSFDQALTATRERVNQLFTSLFHSEEEELAAARPEINVIFDDSSDSDLVKDLLEEKGFKNPDAAFESLKLLRGNDPHKRLTERGRRLLDRLAPLLMGEVLDSPNPDQVMSNLEAFIRSIRARTSYFSLLAENPGIVKLLVALFSSSQMLSRIFVQRPELLDSLVARAYATANKDREQLAAELAEQMALAGDYELQLDTLRRFRNEEFLRIALADLHGEAGQGDTTRQLSWLAEVCLDQAVALSRSELTGRFGAPFADETTETETAFAIIGMGKLGGLELNYHSDLDVIFIYEGEGQTRSVAETDGKRFRQISNREYFAKLGQRIITTLSLVTREGIVYKIDTQLRPSGNQGPLVTSFSAFADYHQESAQSWERQALTKARVVSGPAIFAGRIQELISQLTFERPLPDDLQAEIYRLRGRMEREIARENAEHINIKTGRGGMVDVEFLVQYLQLLHAGAHPQLHQQNTLDLLQSMGEKELISIQHAELLTSSYKFLRQLENKLRLLYDQSMNELSAEPKKLRKIALSLGYDAAGVAPEEAFLKEYRRVTEGVRELFEIYLNPQSGGATGKGT